MYLAILHSIQHKNVHFMLDNGISTLELHHGLEVWLYQAECWPNWAIKSTKINFVQDKENGILELHCCLEVWLYQAKCCTIWAITQPYTNLCYIKVMGVWNCIVAWRSDSIKPDAEPFKLLNQPTDNGTLELCCCLEVWLYQAEHWTIWALTQPSGNLELRRGLTDLLQAVRWTIELQSQPKSHLC